MKPKASKNKAKDVETKPPSPQKLKRINLPGIAKIEISRMSQNLNKYLQGVAVGLGIKDKWAFDERSMQFIVEDKSTKKLKRK